MKLKPLKENKGKDKDCFIHEYKLKQQQQNNGKLNPIEKEEDMS